MCFNRKRIAAVPVIVLLLVAGIIYFNFLSEQIYKESQSHLQEIYNKSDASLSMFVSRNRSILADWGSYANEAPDESDAEVIRRFMNQAKENWGFTEFYFIDAQGEYITVDGERGYIAKLVGTDEGDGGKIAFDGTRSAFTAVLSNGEKQVLFAGPAIDGSYMGFDYSGVCISYTSQAVREIIDISSFYGASESYVVYPNGDVMFSTIHGNDIGDIADELRKNNIVQESVVEQLCMAIEDGETGMFSCDMNGERYYIVYQPVTFEDGMIVGTVPQSVVNSNMRMVQISTLILLSCVFIVAVVIVGAYIYQRGRKRLGDKIRELEYRDRVMDMITMPTDDIYVMFSGQYEVKYVSPNIKRVLGIEKEAVRENIHELMSSVIDDLRTLSDERLNSIARGKSWYADRYLINQETKECRWYREMIYHIADDVMDNYVLLLSDRTKERRAAEQLKSALDSAKSANEAKSIFLSSMSHDIRTPLNAIMGCADLLQRSASDEAKVKEYAGKIVASGKLLLSLINDILDMSKLESGRVSLNLAPFQLSELVDEVSAVILPQAAAKGQELEIVADEVRGEGCIGDKIRLTQILLNLLSNAVKYTQNGGRIVFKITKYGGAQTRGEEKYQKLCFEVTDNGIGMTQDFLKDIFEPFVREKNDTTGEIQGTGLGMAITKNLVEIMGGSISVTSRKGEGSTFLVKLKLQSCADTAQKCEEPGESESMKGFSIEGMRFLVAEDYELNYEILQERLKLEGASCEAAANGKETVEMFEKSEPGYYDAILMDVQMPVMNGYEATAAIRAGTHPLHGTVPIVAMTANAFEEDEMKSLEAGMNAHLTKPVDMEQLKRVVNEVRMEAGYGFKGMLQDDGR